MEADDKENIDEYNPLSRVSPKMESSDQNKSLSADGMSICMKEGGLQPVDLTTDQRVNTVAVDHKEARWIKDPFLYRGDSDEDAEVFFGDVTNKEIKKTKKFSARKTVVFVPGFRMDRHLMRYTMCPPALNQLDEAEKPPGNKDFKNDISGEAMEETGTIKGSKCSSTNDKVDIDDNQRGDKDQSEASVETLIGELREIENELNGRETEAEAVTGGICSVLVPTEESEERRLLAAKGEMHREQTSAPDGVSIHNACIEDSGADSVAKYENLISEVINESLHEDDCAPDCSLLLPEATMLKPVSSHSCSVSSGESGGEEGSEESEDEESVNRQIVNNMLRALDRRTAILSALARMRQQPDNNPNTNGKPESFEEMLKASEEKHRRSMERDPTLGYGCSELMPISSDDNLENKCGNDTEELNEQFQILGIQSEEVAPNCCLQKSQHLEECSQNNSSFLTLHSNKNSNGQTCPKEHCERTLISEETAGRCMNTIKDSAAAKDSSPVTVGSCCERKNVVNRESLHSGDALSSCALVFSNRSNNNSNNGDLVPFNTLLDLTNRIDLLPDDKDLAIDNIVAGSTDIDEQLATLPELDVNDVIDLLKEGQECELFTPQRDAGSQRETVSTGIMADGNLMHHHVIGDNTVVVASNNYLGSPTGAMMYHNLPEFPTRIGATHTVTSVRGPISSPGAVRCQRRYRSIYATLPNESIEIETQVVPECPPGTDLLASFGKLNVADTAVPECLLDDSLMTSMQMVLPIDTSLRHQDDKILNVSSCSPSPQSPHFQSKQLPSGQSSSAPQSGDEGLVERPAELVIASPVPIAQSSPEACGFSPSVVFTEKNFSPILKVHFPGSPPIEVPTGLKCTAHSLFQPKSTTFSSHFISREKKRKQPYGEDCLAATVVPSVNLQKCLTKVKATPAKGRTPRTPPKKVIGSPTIHKFHTAFGKNPASRSLIHQFGIHVSPRPVGRAALRTPGSNLRARTKSPVSARKLLSSKPAAISTTPSNKADLIAPKAMTPGSIKKKTPNSLKKETSCSVGVQSSTVISGGPTKLHNSHRSIKMTPAKLRQPPNSVSSTHQSSAKKSTAVTTTLKHGPAMSPLFSRSTPSKRCYGTPVRTGYPMPNIQERKFGQHMLNSKPRGTAQRVIKREAAMFSPSARRTVNPQHGAESKQTPTRALQELTEGLGLTPLIFDTGKPPVFNKGSPRYLPGDSGDGSDVTTDVVAEPPPPFKLYDFNDSPKNGETASPEGSPRLSMEEVLERQRQQMITLRAEKRKIHDIKTRQSDKELDAVTQVHTLCNSQRTVKVIHKGRAMFIRQDPQSPHLPRRLSWDDDLVVEIGENGAQSITSPEGAASPRKPILSKKDARFVYPYDDESAPPVVVFRSRSGDRRHSTRSPRID